MELNLKSKGQGLKLQRIAFSLELELMIQKWWKKIFQFASTLKGLKKHIPCQLDIHQWRSAVGVLVNRSMTTSTDKMKPRKRKLLLQYASVNIFLQRLQKKMVIPMSTAQMGTYLEYVSLSNHQLSENWSKKKGQRQEKNRERRRRFIKQNAESWFL